MRRQLLERKREHVEKVHPRDWNGTSPGVRKTTTTKVSSRRLQINKGNIQLLRGCEKAGLWTQEKFGSGFPKTKLIFPVKSRDHRFLARDGAFLASARQQKKVGLDFPIKKMGMWAD